MTEDRNERRRGWPWILAVLGLIVLYFLSMGPAAWLEGRGLLPSVVGEAVYGPVMNGVFWIDPKMHHVSYLMMAYLSLWVPLPPMMVPGAGAP